MFKSKYLVPILLLLTIVIRLEHELFNPKFWSDEMAQYIAAKSITENKGPTLPIVLAGDLSNTLYTPLKQFPEGYSYLIAPIWQLSGSLYVAVIFWQWIGILIYLFSFWLVYKLFEEKLDQRVIPFFLLISTFSLSPWLYYKPTDLLAVSFYWLGLALFVIGLTKKQIPNLLFSFLAGFIFTFCMTMRYAYQPIMAVTILSVLGTGFILKNRKIIYSSGITIISAFITWTFYENFLKLPGKLPSEAQSQKIYWENLLQADLTIFNKAFFDDRILFSIFKKLANENIAIISQTTVSIGILSLIIWLLVRKKTFQQLFSDSTQQLFFLVSLVTAITTGGLLYLLSALSKPQENDYLHSWTYVREIRYYAPVFVFVLFTALVLIFNNIVEEKVKKRLTFGLMFLIGISIPYYFLAKYDTIKSDPNYFKIGETKIMLGESNSEILPILKDKIKEGTINNIRPVYLAANRTVRYAQLSGASNLFPDFNALTDIKTTKSVALLIHLGKNDPYNKSDLQAFVKINDLKKEILFLSPSDTLYRFKINP